MAVKLIALDMDGTLMDASHIHVSPRNRAALAQCAARGIHIVLASGRPLALMTDTARALGCVRYAISANGGAVWDLAENHSLFRRAIPPEQAKAILAILTSYPIAAEAYWGGRSHVDRHTWKLEGYEQQPAAFLRFRAERNVFEDDLNLALAGQAVEKFNVDNLPHHIRDEILQRLAPYQDNLAVNFIACYDNLEISRADATKGAALACLCDSLDIAAGEVMAFGDSDNDADMLRWAGRSYAMANGEPAALAAAKAVTASNGEDGVAVALEQAGLA